MRSQKRSLHPAARDRMIALKVPHSETHTPKFAELSAGCFAHPSGALWLPQQAAAAVGGLAMADGTRRAEVRAAALQVDSIALLERLLHELHPRLIVLSSPIAASPQIFPFIRDELRQRLAPLLAAARIVVVDAEVEMWRAIGLEASPAFRELPLSVLSEAPAARPPLDGVLVPGPWHPVVSIGGSSETLHRLPAFLVYPGAILLPAVSVAAPTFDLGRGLPPALASLAANRPAEAFALRRGQFLPLGRLNLRPRAPRPGR